MTNYSERKKKKLNGERVIFGIFLILFVLLVLEVFAAAHRSEIAADNPECILQLKQDYCAIYNMTYGSKVMMTGFLSKNAQTIEICYDDVNEFRLYRSDVDVYKCKEKEYSNLYYYYYENPYLYRCIDDECAIAKSIGINETMMIYVGIE